MWPYYAQVEQALKISGPVTYPWGPRRPRYPYRPHELNAAALVLAKGAEALGIPWTPTPLATLSAPRGLAPPVRVSGNVCHRLRDQRQAECAGHMATASPAGGSRDSRPGDGRPGGHDQADSRAVYTTSARGSGGFKRPAMWWLPDTPSRHRACC